MNYKSTRDGSATTLASKAIIKGISVDGGLFVPSRFPNVEEKLSELMNLDYKSLAAKVMHLYLNEFTVEQLKDYANTAYSDYDHEGIVPTHSLDNGLHMLELWHGPTLAFKDMALQMLPLLLQGSLKIQDFKEKILILVATSGDTGKAALAGFADVSGTAISVFYPDGGVSKAQLLQMVTQDGDNVDVNGIRGNFDDAQSAVKQLFGDEDFNAKAKELGFALSSANSINWGRLLPQIVYYFYAYFGLCKSKDISLGDKINVCVPTGNFGNILAAYYAKRMGLPIDKFICASNVNNVLTDFFTTGVYSTKRDFVKSNSPSMDILISSNLERLLYHISGEDDKFIQNIMQELKDNKEYKVSDELKAKLQAEFAVGYCDEQTTLETIKKVFDTENYLMDPHTAVAHNVASEYKKKTGDNTPCVIASTASPYKFTDSVLMALGEDVGDEVFANASALNKATGVVIPKKLLELKDKAERFKGVCDKQEMKQVILDWIKNNGQ